MLNKLTVLGFMVSALWGQTLFAAGYGTGVFINGSELSHSQLNALETQIRTQVVPGNYIADFQSGCWVNLTNGANGCIGGNASYTSRYGSGSSDFRGNWNHWSNAAGGAVGGTGDGCVYTSFGWSNC